MRCLSLIFFAVLQFWGFSDLLRFMAFSPVLDNSHIVPSKRFSLHLVLQSYTSWFHKSPKPCLLNLYTIYVCIFSLHISAAILQVRLWWNRLKSLFVVFAFLCVISYSTFLLTPLGFFSSPSNIFILITLESLSASSYFWVICGLLPLFISPLDYGSYFLLLQVS